MKTTSLQSTRHGGFGLVELMVGLVIGLLTTVVIMQVFSAFEGQKRTTSGSSDTQTNGALALYSLERELMMAGYGMPLYATKNTPSPMKCTTGVFNVDHDGNTGTPKIGFAPIEIGDGGSGGVSDTVTIRYASANATATKSNSGVPIIIGAMSGATLTVEVSLGCSVNDTALLIKDTDCGMTRVTGVVSGAPSKITVADASHAAVDGTLACLSGWSEVSYSIGSQGSRYWLQTIDSREAGFPNALPRQADIVNIQAQYGITKAAPASEQETYDVDEWVDATGDWKTSSLTIANRNRIRAIRIAVIARSPLKEKEKVTTACAGKFCATWEDPVRTGQIRKTNGSSTLPATMEVAVPGTDWEYYRYRTYQTIVPLRNLIWASPSLSTWAPAPT